MSHVEPGWYRDPSGRFARRYHDGVRWTEHVVDAAGRRGVDPSTRRPRHASDSLGVADRGLSGVVQLESRTPERERQQPLQSEARWGGQDPRPASAGTTGFMLTVGHVATVVGGLLVTLSVVAFDFVRTHSGSSPLSEVAEAPPQVDISPPLDTYATFGRWLVLGVILIAVMAVLRLPARLDQVQKLPVMVAVVCASFLVWSSLASFGHFDLDVAGLGGTVGVATSLDASPAVGAILGVVGYVGMAGGQFLRRPIGGAR